jgi:peptide deformylase
MLTIIDKQHTPKVPYLKKPTVWIEDNQEILKDFLEFAESQHAVGLASNQVAIDGKRITNRFLAIKIGESWKLAINPRIRKCLGESSSKIEGCLTWGSDKIIIADRYGSLDIDYYDIDGEYRKERVTDEWIAQIWQHEINHLDGVEERIVDKMPVPVTYKRKHDKIGRNEPCPCGSGMKYKKCHLGLDISEFLV